MPFSILDEVRMLPFSRTLIQRALETYKVEEVIPYIREGLENWIQIGLKNTELSDEAKRDTSDIIEYYMRGLELLKDGRLDNYLSTLRDDSDLFSTRKGRY